MSRGRPVIPPACEDIEVVLREVQREFSSFGEPVDAEIIEQLRTVLFTAFPNLYESARVIDAEELHRLQAAVAQDFPAGTPPIERYRREHLLWAALVRLAVRGRIQLGMGVRPEKPPRPMVVDPADPQLPSLTRWRRWQIELAKRLATTREPADLIMAMRASLLLWGGPCDPQALEKVGHVNPSTDYDPETCCLSYYDQDRLYLLWCCHPIQRLALLRVRQLCPDGACRSTDANRLLAWLQSFLPDPPRSFDEMLLGARRHLLEYYPPWLVAVLCGITKLRDSQRTATRRMVPRLESVPPALDELALRDTLRQQRRRYLRGCYSTNARDDFRDSVSRLLTQWEPEEAEPILSTSPSEHGRQANIQALLHALLNLATRTNRGATVQTFIDCAVSLLDFLGGFPIRALASAEGKRLLSEASWGAADTYTWALCRLWRAAGARGRLPALTSRPSESDGRRRAIPSIQDLQTLFVGPPTSHSLPNESIDAFTALGAHGLRKAEALHVMAAYVDPWGWAELQVPGTKSRRSRRRIPLWLEPFVQLHAPVLAAATHEPNPRRHLVADHLGHEILREAHPDMTDATTVRSVEHALARRASRGFGISLTPHDLRAAAASNAILAGLPVEAVAKYLGHATLQLTLEHYIQVGLTYQRQALETALQDPHHDLWFPVSNAAAILGITPQALYRTSRSDLTKAVPPETLHLDSRRRFWVRASVIADHLTRRLLGRRRPRRQQHPTPVQER